MTTWRSIQCLRALAAIGVLLFHFGGVRAGEAGVDLFFVISGFIMASVVPGKTPARFLADRVWRILPPYYAAVVLELALVHPPIDAYRLLITATLWPLGLPYLHQSWTLSYEMIFYAGCALYLSWGRRSLVSIPLLLVTGMLVDHPLANFFGSTLILEFLGGILLARLPRRHGMAALAAAPMLFVLLSSAGVDRALAFGVPALLLVHGALCFERRFAARVFDPVMLLGAASFSIYLVHLTIGRLFPDTIAWTTPAVIALLGGLLFHLVVERPMTSAIGRYRSSRRFPQRPLSLAVSDATQ
ncbi:MAG: acyltransferase [Pseudomonadota bacterium]|nr:acyltransferase [Pseudomonadota bacterium]